MTHISLLTRKNPDQFVDTNNISVTPNQRSDQREQFSPNNIVLLLDEFQWETGCQVIYKPVLIIPLLK
jgi:hypothetical protein